MTDKETTYSERRDFWNKIFHFRKFSPVIFYAIVILILVEIIGGGLLPLFMPDNFYISFYLPDHAKLNTAEYLDDSNKYNMRDDLLGWRNRPECVYGKWRVDRHGSRSTHDFTIEPAKPRRIMLLGSSLINGGPFVEIEETISALLEDSVTECINFGTMRYSLDQSYLFYKERLFEYQPDLLIVEIGTNPCEGLLNQYIPFRQQDATDMPFLKPRFRQLSDSLEMLPVPPMWMHDSLYTRPDLFDLLRRNDYYYFDYQIFKHIGMTPLAGFGWRVYSKGNMIRRNMNENRAGYRLLVTLMHRLTEEAAKNGAEVIFLSLPNRFTSFPSGWRQFLPDLYGPRLERLKQEGFDIVDVRQVMRRSGQPFWRLYVYDDRHFTPPGNELIAAEIKKKL